MMLAAFETMAKADPVREPRRLDADIAAQATARILGHAAPPLKSGGREVYNEPGGASMTLIAPET
jgi:hypothetical protein